MTDWGTDAILRELAGAGKGYAVALAALADTADYAERAAENMGRLPGIAHGLRDVKHALETNHRQAQALADQLTPLSGTVEEITTDTTPSQVTAALTPAHEKLGQQVIATMRAKAALGDIETLIRRNLEGGQPEHLLYRVGKARSVLDAIQQRLDKAKTATEAVLANARTAGTTETTAAGARGQEPLSYVRRIAAALPDAGAKTVGQLVDRSGQPLSGVLWSGEDGPGRGAPGIRRDGPKPWADMTTVLQHVEGHAAAVLRRPDAPTEAVLVVSRPPCDGRFGCDRILPDTLPRRTRLWVYVRGEDGEPYLFNGRPYAGNGLGVE